MCGITGFAGNSNGRLRKDNLVEMTDAVYHRGPDDRGVWISGNNQVGLGHRRLSIIDLSTRAAQPMRTSDDRFVIVYNGEVYNFREIRIELEQRGHTFLSNSDTEVVLRAYVEWREKSSLKFNGMWAFAIYDKSENLLFLSRDRLGIKPLYYYFDGDNFLFGSEIKSIIASGLYKAKLNLKGLNEYFTFQNIISDRTFFSDIQLLEPGYNLSLSLDKLILVKKEYWDFRYEPGILSEAEYQEMIRESFSRSIRRHLISDVEIGATISGGMDSSSIVSTARSIIDGMKSFTGFFDTGDIDLSDRAISERDDARIIANLFNTDHHERRITPQDVIDTLPSIMWHLEDPKVGMCYTFYTISQLVAQKVKVNLSGTGGDEAYAGYPWRYQVLNDKDYLNSYYHWWCRIAHDNEKANIFREEHLKSIDTGDPRRQFDKIVENAGNVSRLNRILYFENKTFLHGMLLMEDKMAMAFSLESRFPFLDNEMIQLAMEIPDSMKYKDNIPKYMLKSAFKDILPEDIIHKRKQGFTPPDKTWYKGELKSYIVDLLTGYRSRVSEYINPSYIQKMLQLHFEGNDQRLHIWSLLMLESWLRTFDTNSARINKVSY